MKKKLRNWSYIYLFNPIFLRFIGTDLAIPTWGTTSVASFSPEATVESSWPKSPPEDPCRCPRGGTISSGFVGWGQFFAKDIYIYGYESIPINTIFRYMAMLEK